MEQGYFVGRRWDRGSEMIARPDIVTVAILSLAVGLGLYWQVVLRGNSPYAHRTNVMCWLLIAMFTVLILFLFFPDSTASGTVFGISLGGALAAFCFVWIYGVRLTGSATKLDELEARVRRAEAEARQAARSLAARATEKRPEVISTTRVYRYKIRSRPSREIAIITGNIQRITVADVWVNSENTNMQPSRYFEGTISAAIRYYGAKRDIAGNVTEDVIANELALARGSYLTVQPATVLVTGPGELATTNNVKKIFHVAAVEGRVNGGYRQVSNVDECVIHALTKVDSLELASIEMSSVLFSLMGTGRAHSDLETTAEKLIGAAADYLEHTEVSRVRCVYFLAWTDVELEVCQAVLGTMNQIMAADGAKRSKVHAS